MNVREIERKSIRDFMEKNREYLSGRVLDFGSGRQPYRDLVSGEYVAFERDDYLSNVGMVDCVMCNQVLQYVPDPYKTLCKFSRIIQPGGFLVMTYPTCWTEAESDDMWRFTRSGMEHLLVTTGFKVLVHERRAEIVNDEDGFVFPLGYGVVASV